MKFRLLHILLGIPELDRQIDKLRDLRNSYREANRSYYGEYLAAILDDEPC